MPIWHFKLSHSSADSLNIKSSGDRSSLRLTCPFLTPAVAAAHADYLATLKTIADRLKDEKSQSTDNIKLALGAQ